MLEITARNKSVSVLMKSTFQKVAGLKDETNQYVADKN
jgi:hypothetical protein